MKIKRITGGYQNTTLWFTFACSQCEAEVDGGDKFCYNCGHKMSALPDHVSTSETADILTAALRKELVSLAKN